MTARGGVWSGCYVRLIAGCERFAGPVREACYRWLGKAVAVLTDGTFEREGCPALEPEDARRSCVASASELERPLVTFS